jgi:predicted phage terminase large subunit-like protein
MTVPSVHEEEAAYCALLAGDFYSFVEYVFRVVRPNVLFRPNWHIEAIAHKLAQVALGQCKRLIITLPPRNLKSICASVALPAWFLGHFPSERAVVACYSDQLSRNHANDFRLVGNEPFYQAAFPGMRLARDTDREIVTTQRGKRLATSVDGTLTGLGGNLIVVDDPIKLGDVYSEAVRRKVIDWYKETLVSRADDKINARIVVVMQRVHQDDLVGYLIEQGGYEVLNLPAIAQREETYELGNGGIYTRKRGELLHPAHEPAEVLREIKREMGPIAFAAQYQQTPAPPGGNLIRREWLNHRYDPVEIQMQRDDRIIMSWDIAMSEASSSDYSACAVLLQRKEVIFVLEMIHGKFPFETLKRKVMEVKRRYAGATLLIEDSAISYGLIQSLREQSINVTKYKPKTDKTARVIAQSDRFEGGSVRLPQKAPWLDSLIHELLAFPGRHDDQVDALVQGIAWARERGRGVHVGYVSGLI